MWIWSKLSCSFQFGPKILANTSSGVYVLSSASSPSITHPQSPKQIPYIFLQSFSVVSDHATTWSKFHVSGSTYNLCQVIFIHFVYIDLWKRGPPVESQQICAECLNPMGFTQKCRKVFICNQKEPQKFQEGLET